MDIDTLVFEITDIMDNEFLEDHQKLELIELAVRDFCPDQEEEKETLAESSLKMVNKLLTS